MKNNRARNFEDAKESWDFFVSESSFPPTPSSLLPAASRHPPLPPRSRACVPNLPAYGRVHREASPDGFKTGREWTTSRNLDASRLLIRKDRDELQRSTIHRPFFASSTNSIVSLSCCSKQCFPHDFIIQNKNKKMTIIMSSFMPHLFSQIKNAWIKNA